MLEKEDSPDPVRELMRVLRQLARAGSEQPALFPDENVSAGELVRAFDQRALALRGSYDDRLSPSQVETLTALEEKLSTMSRDGAEFDADIWTDEAVRTSERWAEVRVLAAAALDAFSDTSG
jgi:hypothetical protein